MRLLYLIACICTPFFSLAQEKEVVITGSGVKTNVNKDDASVLKSKVNKVLLDTLRPIFSNSEKITSVIDSIKALSTAKKVFSQKQWKTMYDSLTKLPSINIPPVPSFAKKPVSEQELIDAVRRKFYEAGKDSLSKIKSPKDSIDGFTNSLEEKLPGLPSYNPLNPQRLELAKESLLALMPMQGHVIPTKLLKAIDSVRKINLGKERLNLREKQVAAKEKLINLKRRPTFWDRSYFEGVVGFTPGTLKILQFAPTMGYHFTDYLSLGIGPNLLVREDQKKLLATVGIKTFFKAEFLKRRGYFQLEDILDSYGVQPLDDKHRTILEKHNLFAGGGFLLTMKSRISLNFSILYCVTQEKVVSHQLSPMVFRIGLSSIKSLKQ